MAERKASIVTGYSFLVVVPLGISLVGLVTYCWMYHLERRQWLLRPINLDTRYSEIASACAAAPVTVFDVLYDLVSVDDRFIRAIVDLGLDQHFESIDELLKYLHHRAGVPLGARRPPPLPVSVARPISRPHTAYSEGVQPSEERDDGFLEECGVFLPSGYVTVVRAALRAAAATKGVPAERVTDQVCAVLIREFGPPIASRILGYATHFIVPHGNHPLVTSALERACGPLLSWLVGQWQGRHLRAALAELTERSKEFLIWFQHLYPLVTQRATARHMCRVEALRYAYRAREPWRWERVLQPALGTKFAKMAVARTNAEIREIDSYFLHLSRAVSRSLKRGESSEVVAGELHLFNHCDAPPFALPELLAARGALATALSRVDAERSLLQTQRQSG